MTLFMQDKEKALFNSLNQELLGETWNDQSFYYLEVDVEKSQWDDLYGELEDIAFKDAVKFQARIEKTQDMEIFTSNIAAKADEFERIGIYLTKQSLLDMNYSGEIKEMAGNYVMWAKKLYEIITARSPRLIDGRPEWEWEAILDCRMVDKVNDTLYNSIVDERDQY